MGNKKDNKWLLLVLILLGTCLLAYKSAVLQGSGVNGLPLKDSLQNIEGYRAGIEVPLEKGIYEMLALDDFVFTNYTKEQQHAALYIGHYYTIDKLTAAHSPLVCFPSQGWTIDKPTIHELTIGDDTLHYAELVATLGERKELILYWYQAGHKSSPHLFQIKIATLLNKLGQNNQQHAFVRVSVPFSNTERDQAKTTGLDFIKAFWPHYTGFIKNNIAR